MRQWAEMYRRDPDGSYAERCGSDSICYMDGRFGRERQHDEARRHAQRTGSDGYRLARGDSILRPFYLTAAIIPVTAPVTQEVTKPTSYAVGVGVDPYDLSVIETKDGFGRFKTKRAAAEYLISVADERITTLKASRDRAKRVIRKIDKDAAR